jgi:hypothetical protein
MAFMAFGDIKSEKFIRDCKVSNFWIKFVTKCYQSVRLFLKLFYPNYIETVSSRLANAYTNVVATAQNWRRFRLLNKKRKQELVSGLPEFS